MPVRRPPEFLLLGLALIAVGAPPERGRRRKQAPREIHRLPRRRSTSTPVPSRRGLAANISIKKELCMPPGPDHTGRDHLCRRPGFTPPPYTET